MRLVEINPPSPPARSSSLIATGTTCSTLVIDAVIQPATHGKLQSSLGFHIIKLTGAALNKVIEAQR